MRKYELEERTIKISEALEPEQRFEKKKIGLHQVCHKQKRRNTFTLDKAESGKRSVFVNGQLAARVENDGLLKYYKYEDVEDEVQELMNKWLTKN